MPNSSSLTYAVTATLVEILPAAQAPGAASEAARTVTQAGFNAAQRVLKSDSSPPVTCGALFQQALTSGSATIDLTALDGLNDKVVNGTGLRVQLLRLKAPSSNANPITVAKGVSNGYDGFGSAFSVTLQPGAEMTFLANDAGSDVGAGNKTLDLTGTGTQALDVEIIMG
jgi:hypothetical protein